MNLTPSSILTSLLTGLTMSLTSLPQLISYSSLLSVSPLSTLMSAPPGMLAWAFVSTSPNMLSGISAVTAQLAYNDLHDPSLDEREYARHVSAYAVVTGLASIMLAAAGVGRLVGAVDAEVLKGFKWGASFGILVGALPNAVFKGGNGGMKGIRGVLPGAVMETIDKTGAKGMEKVCKLIYTVYLGLTSQAPTLDLSSIIMFLMCYAIISYLPAIYTRVAGSKPPPGSAVILATFLATAFVIFSPTTIGYTYTGLTVGSVPTSSSAMLLPSFSPIQTQLDIISLITHHGFFTILTKATIFSAISYLSVLSILPSLPPSSHPDPSKRNFVAQGVSCIVSGAFGGAPVGASLSRSMISVMMDVSDNLPVVVQSAAYLLGLKYILMAVENTPKAALSAVLETAVVGSVMSPKKMDAVGWITGIAVASVGANQGFAIGMVAWAFRELLDGGKKGGKQN